MLQIIGRSEVAKKSEAENQRNFRNSEFRSTNGSKVNYTKTKNNKKKVYQ